MIVAGFDRTYEGWRDAARRLVTAGAPPEDILWTAEPSLFATEALSVGTANIAVPKQFVALADLVSCHRDEAKWSLLYRVLYRIVQGERHLLAIESDPDVNVLYRMRKEITHDMHRMKAFVRFRKVDDRFIAWHKPDHLIVEKMAPWFAERFGSMKWSILTPDRSVHWDLQKLSFGPGASATEAPTEDALEDLWRAYYASTFNPNRVNEKALRNHVPARYWAAMPETVMIPGLIVDAKARGHQMCEAKPISAAAFVPQDATLPILRQAVHDCRGCDLHERATQPVFGEGPADAQDCSCWRTAW